MKITDKFILTEIAGNYILVPTGQFALNFNGVITLNETAKFLWENCGDEKIDLNLLSSKLIAEYDVDENTAKSAVEAFINQMEEAGCIE